MTIWYIVLILLGTIAYRIGGMSKEEWKYTNTKWRDWGTNLCALLVFFIHRKPDIIGLWLLLLTFLLQWIALSSYWKTGSDMKWYNWVYVAMGYSLSALPLLWLNASPIDFTIRSLILIVTIPFVCQNTDNVWIEESYRGLAFTSTYLLL